MGGGSTGSDLFLSMAAPVGGVLSFQTTNGYVKRPMNSYMLFARDNRRRVQKLNPNLNLGQISTVLGIMWRHLSVNQRDYYKSLSQQLTELHQSLYPTYKYSPGMRRRHNKAEKSSDRHSRKKAMAAMRYLASRKYRTIRPKRDPLALIMEKLQIHSGATEATEPVLESRPTEGLIQPRSADHVHQRSGGHSDPVTYGQRGKTAGLQGGTSCSGRFNRTFLQKRKIDAGTNYTFKTCTTNRFNSKLPSKVNSRKRHAHQRYPPSDKRGSFLPHCATSFKPHSSPANCTLVPSATDRWQRSQEPTAANESPLPRRFGFFGLQKVEEPLTSPGTYSRHQTPPKIISCSSPGSVSSLTEELRECLKDSPWRSPFLSILDLNSSPRNSLPSSNDWLVGDRTLYDMSPVFNPRLFESPQNEAENPVCMESDCFPMNSTCLEADDDLLPVASTPPKNTLSAPYDSIPVLPHKSRVITGRLEEDVGFVMSIPDDVTMPSLETVDTSVLNSPTYDRHSELFGLA